MFPMSLLKRGSTLISVILIVGVGVGDGVDVDGVIISLALLYSCAFE
jgi:hypothetical protein